MFKWANLSKLPRPSKVPASYRREIFSPDSKLRCTFILEMGSPYYEVTYQDRPLVTKSCLGFLIHGESTLGANLELLRAISTRHHENITQPFGDTSTIDNTYHSVTFHLRETRPPHRRLALEFRIFNDSVAFRYLLEPHENISRVSIKAELTEFNVAPSSVSWSIPAYQPDRYEYNYEKLHVSDLTHPVHTPLTIKTPDGTYLCIHEAALYDYGAMNLVATGTRLRADITPLSDNTKAHIKLPFSTPWRLIMVAPTSLALTTNHTMYALNPAPTTDFSWVHPLKFLGIWWAMYIGEYTWAPSPRHGATTEHALQYLEKAAKLGLSGLLIEGWNDGWEGDWLENGATTHFTTASPDFDINRVSNAASTHDIEIIGHHETVGFIDNYESQLDSAYNYYLKHGIHYIKVGYSGAKMHIHGLKEYHHSQAGVRHYQRALELAAKKHICLNIHEPIKGTGIERTFPNLLTREGARGQEYEGGPISPSHACTLSFTRLLAGGMDYTPGIFDLDNPKKPIHTTITRQLAYFVTIYSAMLMAADRPEMYEKYPDLYDFIRSVPVNYRTSIPLAGEIGKFYAIARLARDTDEWYLGAVTDEHSRTITLPLDFLDSNTKYRAHIYEDGKDAHYLTNKFSYRIHTKIVRKGDTLSLYLAPGGGAAVRIAPLD